MNKRTIKEEVNVCIAKNKLENKGINLFKTKLFETDCKLVKKTKTFLLTKYKSNEYEITPDFARQVINIDELINFKNIMQKNKLDFESMVGKKEYNFLFKNIYYALNIYALKLDEVSLDKSIEKLVEICANKIETKSSYYGTKHILNPMLEEEKKFLKLLLAYNAKKIAIHQKENFYNPELNIESEKEN